MGLSEKYLTLIAILAVAFLCLGAPAAAHEEEDVLPELVITHLHTPLTKVGNGTYRKFGFTIYHISLWAPGGVWNPAKPYALKLRYTRSLSKDTLADTVVGDIHDQDVTDPDTFARWEKEIREDLPAVEDGDVLIGTAIPGKGARLFLNGKQIAEIHDQALSRAFFNIWLGDDADEDLRKELTKG